jgi:hypothetical protein
MKLTVGSHERLALKAQIEGEIINLADKWTYYREAVITGQRDSTAQALLEQRFHRAAEKLAKTVRKWRRI